MRQRIPLAWLQLIHEKMRLAVAIAGIAFATILIFVQLGFQDALYDGCLRPHRSLNADLVMINPQFETFFSVKSFSRLRLYQCLGVDGVQTVAGLLVGKGSFKNPENNVSRDILIFACDPLKQPFLLNGLCHEMPKLTMLNRVIFDVGSRPEYGHIKDAIDHRGYVDTEVNRKSVRVAGDFLLGASFAADGNMLTSDSTFLRLFPERQADQIEVGLIKLDRHASAGQVQSELIRRVAPGVTILTMKEFADRERSYWARSTGIGFIFGLGVVVGFVVGVVIVYQILHSGVCDHLAEYATLKGIGYTDRYLLSVVMQEAMILAFGGYIPGLFLSVVLYRISGEATLLPITMTAGRAALVLVLTLVMCASSAAIAMHKLRDADPAEIF